MTHDRATGHAIAGAVVIAAIGYFSILLGASVSARAASQPDRTIFFAAGAWIASLAAGWLLLRMARVPTRDAIRLVLPATIVCLVIGAGYDRIAIPEGIKLIVVLVLLLAVGLWTARQARQGRRIAT